MNYSKLIIFVFLLSGVSFAQFSKTVEVSSWYDDNLYRSPVTEEDILTNIGIWLNYHPLKTNLNYFYNGNFFLYNSATLRNFSLHNLGFNYFDHFGKDDQQKYYLGADLSVRIDGEEYIYYDYNQLYAYANFNFNLDYAFIKTGYNFRYRNYSNLPDLTNFRHYIFVQANKSFETRTSVILETDIGYKNFAGQENYLSSGGGRGRHSVRESETVLEIPSMSQAIFMARIAQSLHEKVGVYIQYRKQISLNNQAANAISDNYYQDEEIFDDPFSYESETISSQLTWMMPWSMKMQVGGALLSKNYISEQAFISAEDTLGLGGTRLDDQGNYFVNLSKTFYLDKNWANSLNFYLNYSYIRNKSNSYWYDYKNSVFGGGVEWNF